MSRVLVTSVEKRYMTGTLAPNNVKELIATGMKIFHAQYFRNLQKHSLPNFPLYTVPCTMTSSSNRDVPYNGKKMFANCEFFSNSQENVCKW